MKKTNFKFSKGFTFLETIIAIFLVSVSLFGCVSALVAIFKSSYFSYNRLIAAYLAQEGIEIVRNIRDTNWLENRYSATTSWNEGLTNCRNGCQIDYFQLNQEDPSFSSFDGAKLKIASDGFFQYSNGQETPFSRKITIEEREEDGNEVLNIKIEISWQEREKPKEFILVSKLYNN